MSNNQLVNNLNETVSYIQDKTTGLVSTAVYKATKSGSMRYHVNGKKVADSTFDRLYKIVPPPPPPFIEVKRWKEFFSYVPEKLQTNFAKKYYRKLFSLARNKFWTVYVDGAGKYKFYYGQGDFESYYIGTFINENSRISKLPSKIYLPKFKCKSTGFETTLESDCGFKRNWASSLLQCMGDSKGNYVCGYFSTYSQIVNEVTTGKLQDISFIGRKDEIDAPYFRNNLFTEQVEYFVGGSYSTYLIVQDFLWYKKGQIVSRQYYEKDYYKRNPKELLPYGHYYSIYQINNCIACDLNLITFEKLRELLVHKESCSRRKIGCDKGCRDYCVAESSDKRNTTLINYFIKTKQKLGI